MNIAEKFEHKGLAVEIIYDEDAQNPRDKDWADNLDTMVCFHGRYNLGDEGHGYKQEDYNSWDELKTQIIKDHKPVVIKPLYLYDHSGITISTSPFSCPWDSGQVGFVFISRKAALDNWSKSKKTSNKSLEARVEKYINASVDEYDKYLRGEVFGYSVKKGEEELDSCWGFIGREYCIEEAKSIAEHCAEKVTV